MTTNAVADTGRSTGASGAQRRMWRRFMHRPLGVIALIIFAIILLVALTSHWFAPFDPNFVDFTQVRKPPNGDHLLGGDSAGRDVFSRLLYGATTTLYGALIACLAGIVLGVPFGVASGYFGGKFDKVCTWISDALQSIPGMIALLIVAAGTGNSFTMLMVTLGVFISPGYFRISRSRTLTVRRAVYVDAAKVSGLSDVRILGSHVVKAVYAPIIIQTGLTGGLAMGIQAGLQFLGVGSSNQVSWGAMMTDGFNNVRLAPLLLVWPSIALGLAIASLAIIGSTLGDLVTVRTDDGAKTPKKRRNRALAARDRAAATNQPADAAASHAAGSSVDTGDERGVSDTPGNTGELASSPPEAALSIKGLRVQYGSGAGAKQVLHGVSLDVAPGEVLGIVGESGSGKTQTVFSVMDLLPSGGTSDVDELWIEGTEVSRMARSKRQALLGRRIGYVPQEPMTNLDPCYTIGRHLMEPLQEVHGLSKPKAAKRAKDILTQVGIHDPERVMGSYPHQISGGMAQRVLIAGAVIGKPSIILADEPTTALDVTVQAEVLELLRELQAAYNLALVMVTHNFGVVADICDRVVVMKDGDVVETGNVDEIFANPKDPYTRELINASLDDAADRHALDAADREMVAASTGEQGSDVTS